MLFFTAMFFGGTRTGHAAYAARIGLFFPKAGFHVSIHAEMAIGAEAGRNAEIQKSQYKGQ